jgi:hypothetical protein
MVSLSVVLFLEATAIYLIAWVGAFSAEGRRLAPLTLRRILVLVLLFPAFAGLQLLHWLGLLLDDLLIPAYRRQRVERPVFILGVPRSGTTYLHRELARDQHFCTAQTWELLLAPSLVERYLVRAMVGADRLLGAPLARLLAHLSADASAAMEDVHPVGLTAAEEDYLALLPVAGCFFAHLALPQAKALSALSDPGELTAGRRRRLLQHYHRNLQRQLYASGGGQLLSKNAAFAAWSPYLRRQYPDALIILCVREPVAAIASQLRSLVDARRLLAVDPRGTWVAERFSALYEQWYSALTRFSREDSGPFLVVEQSELRNASREQLYRIYARLGRAPQVDGEDASPEAGARDRTRYRDATDLSTERTRADYQYLRTLAAGKG